MLPRSSMSFNAEFLGWIEFPCILTVHVTYSLHCYIFKGLFPNSFQKSPRVSKMPLLSRPGFLDEMEVADWPPHVSHWAPCQSYLQPSSLILQLSELTESRMHCFCNMARPSDFLPFANTLGLSPHLPHSAPGGP